MCGIWGLFGSKNSNAYRACADRIAHRGPDCSTFETFENILCSLAFYRLRIVGHESNGKQPMRLSKFPEVTLLCNGEIYNYKTLLHQFNIDPETDSDCEVILHLYKKLGIKDTCSLLDGVFAFIILDVMERKIYLSRDLYGVRPMYYFMTEEMLGVCSELKGLMDVDVEGKQIQWFPPAHYAEFQINLKCQVTEEKREKYHNICKTPVYIKYQNLCLKENSSLSSVLQNIRVLLTNAVEKRLMSDRKVGVFLSGGLDSSLVAGIAALKLKAEGAEKLTTFSIGFNSSTDLVQARKVAKHIGSDHHEYIISHEDAVQAIDDVIFATETYDANTLRPSVPMYLLSKYISQHTDVVVILSGEGADELAQGYNYFHSQPSPSEGDKESRRLLENIHLYDVLRTDKCTSSHGLEVRVPFLDHAFSSYYLSLPQEMRCPNKGHAKYPIRLAFQEMNIIPNFILWREKEGFGDGMGSNEKHCYGYLRKSLVEITDTDVKKATSNFPHNTPQTKEEIYYRKIFNEKFEKENAHLIPAAWRQQWVKLQPGDGELVQYSNTILQSTISAV